MPQEEMILSLKALSLVLSSIDGSVIEEILGLNHFSGFFQSLDILFKTLLISNKNKRVFIIFLSEGTRKLPGILVFIQALRFFILYYQN